MSKEKLGKVSVVPRGIWTSETTYEPLDTVTYNGSSWIARQATSTVPAEGDDWQNLVSVTKDGVIDVLGYTPAEEEGTFQFVSSTTLEEDASIEFTGLSLRRCYIEVELPVNGSATGASLVFSTKESVTSRIWISAAKASSYRLLLWAEIYPCGNYYRTISSGFGIPTNRYPIQAYLELFSKHNLKISGPIVRVCFLGTCTAGTTAKVYGIPW